MKKFILGFVVALILCGIVVGAYILGTKNVTKGEEVKDNEIINQEENDNEIDIIEENNEEKDDNKVILSNEEIIEIKFKEYLSKLEIDGEGKLKEYKIEAVNILEKEEIEEVNKSMESNKYDLNDILATVSYSIRPEGNSNAWLIGNGEIEGEWIKGKTCCTKLENNNLTIIGTGW